MQATTRKLAILITHATQLPVRLLGAQSAIIGPRSGSESSRSKNETNVLKNIRVLKVDIEAASFDNGTFNLGTC